MYAQRRFRYQPMTERDARTIARRLRDIESSAGCKAGKIWLALNPMPDICEEPQQYAEWFNSQKDAG